MPVLLYVTSSSCVSDVWLFCNVAGFGVSALWISLFLRWDQYSAVCLAILGFHFAGDVEDDALDVQDEETCQMADQTHVKNSKSNRPPPSMGSAAFRGYQLANGAPVLYVNMCVV